MLLRSLAIVAFATTLGAGRAVAQTDSLTVIYRDAARLPLLTSLLVAKDGNLLREAYFNGLRAGQPVNVKSVSKSVLSALLGIAVAEGRLRESDRMADLLPDYFATVRDSARRSLTLRHFMTMTTGLESTSFNNYGSWVNSRDWVRHALQRPFVCAPGACMTYSTGNSHVLSVALAKRTGMSTRAYATLSCPTGSWS